MLRLGHHPIAVSLERAPARSPKPKNTKAERCDVGLICAVYYGRGVCESSAQPLAPALGFAVQEDPRVKEDVATPDPPDYGERIRVPMANTHIAAESGETGAEHNHFCFRIKAGSCDSNTGGHESM